MPGSLARGTDTSMRSQTRSVIMTRMGCRCRRRLPRCRRPRRQPTPRCPGPHRPPVRRPRQRLRQHRSPGPRRHGRLHQRRRLCRPPLPGPCQLGASLCPGPFTRWPDYWTLNVAVGYAFKGTIGIGGSAYIDRYGRFYLAGAPLSLGEGLPFVSGLPVSANLSAGWLCQTETPQKEELQGFLTGWGTKANIGAVIGLGVSESGGRKAMELGLYWPQIGGSIYHSWFITDFSALLSAPSIESYPAIDWDPSWGSPP